MANITLIRADFRLIHGQVITKWTKEANANRIVVINDLLAQDEFMASIYVMAAPPGMKVDIYSIKEAVDKYKENMFGDGNVLLLFKSIKDIYDIQQLGFPVNELQIGGLGGGPGRTNVLNQISFDKNDVGLLREIQNNGTFVYLHVLPTEPKVELNTILNKYSF